MNFEERLEQNRANLEKLIPVLDTMLNVMPHATLREAILSGTPLSVDAIEEAVECQIECAQLHDEAGREDMSKLCRKVVALCALILAVVEGGIH